MVDARELEEGTNLSLEFDKLGRIGARGQRVVPVVLQHAESGAVLFVGYANREALRETLRRRRATGGPAEQTFATLVGLELRPRRLREAATLWRTLREQRGAEGRDELWRHPDLLPSADDLDDPEGFIRRSGETGELDPGSAG